jgi:hypothetical protein
MFAKGTTMRRARFPRTATAWTHAATYVLAWAIMLGTVAYVVWPLLHGVHLLGGHDWDQQESYRYYVAKVVLRYHQFPFWNPYSCGGYPAWGNFESDTTVVSPFFPAYLALELPIALRIEIIGDVLFSVLGAWLFAGRFTRSPAARAFVVVLFAVNGRWSLQVAPGHTWHLAYNWTPWVLYFIDRAFVDWTRTNRFPGRHTVWAGICLAMMVYMGGIYPLPQTILAVAFYAGLYSIMIRDWRPVLSSLAAGILSFCLSAPKLLPVLEVVSKYPRITESPEAMDLALFLAVLTSRDQDVNSQPVHPPFWAWQEWGMYIGLVPLALLVVGLIALRGERANALKWTAIVLLALGFGSIHPAAPWSILHRLPIFKSQHVPSRWLYPALLLAATSAAAAAELLMKRAGAKRPWLEWAAILAVGAIAFDVAPVARLPLLNAFAAPVPAVPESLGEFHNEIHMPPEIESAGRGWAPSALPAEMANIGTIDCGVFVGFHNYFRDGMGHTPGLGAKGRGDPAYKGEVYVVEGRGKAQITRWTPNIIEVRVEGARPGDHVALNQNYDPGWHANGRPALDWSDVVAAPIHSDHESFVFRYVPRLWWPGTAIFAVPAIGLVWCGWRARRIRRRARVALANARA